MPLPQRRPSAASLSAISAATISATGSSWVTMPTDWPAIKLPFSTSPSITARLSAPAQKCSILSRSEEHTSELQSHRDLHSFPTRRSSDLGDHADRLAGHQAAVLDIAVDHRALERAGPEMLDPE